MYICMCIHVQTCRHVAFKTLLVNVLTVFFYDNYFQQGTPLKCLSHVIKMSYMYKFLLVDFCNARRQNRNARHSYIQYAPIPTLQFTFMLQRNVKLLTRNKITRRNRLFIPTSLSNGNV